MNKFDFENLNVYQQAIDFADEIFTVTGDFLGKVQLSLGDQLRRAALSISDNIAEGNDKKSKREKTRFFEYAPDSAGECIPMITIPEPSSLYPFQLSSFNFCL